MPNVNTNLLRGLHCTCLQLKQEVFEPPPPPPPLLFCLHGVVWGGSYLGGVYTDYTIQKMFLLLDFLRHTIQGCTIKNCVLLYEYIERILYNNKYLSMCRKLKSPLLLSSLMKVNGLYQNKSI